MFDDDMMMMMLGKLLSHGFVAGLLMLWLKWVTDSNSTMLVSCCTLPKKALTQACSGYIVENEWVTQEKSKQVCRNPLRQSHPVGLEPLMQGYAQTQRACAPTIPVLRFRWLLQEPLCCVAQSDSLQCCFWTTITSPLGFNWSHELQ
jgi:hypothetical protein